MVIISYFISSAFFSVFQMTIDTMLLCFCEDIERHGERDDNSAAPGQRFYMSKELYSHLSDSEKRKSGGCCCC